MRANKLIHTLYDCTECSLHSLCRAHIQLPSFPQLQSCLSLVLLQQSAFDSLYSTALIFSLRNSHIARRDRVTGRDSRDMRQATPHFMITSRGKEEATHQASESSLYTCSLHDCCTLRIVLHGCIASFAAVSRALFFLLPFTVRAFLPISSDPPRPTDQESLAPNLPLSQDETSGTTFGS